MTTDTDTHTLRLTASPSTAPTSTNARPGGSGADRMRAVGREVYGSFDVVHLRDEPRPEPGPDEVLVRVHAAGVDRGAWHLMAGLPYLVRLAGFGVRRPKEPLLGAEVAGRVEAVGRDVTRFRLGDRVHGTGAGTFAEYVCTAERRLAPTPARLSDVEAAAMPISGITALQGLQDVGDLQPGQHVLVIGASGGVGSFAVQVAKALGAEVTGVCSTPKVEAVRALGADHVIDHRMAEITDDGTRYDLILDIGGNRRLSLLRQALTAGGTLVIAGGEGKGRVVGGVDRQARAMLLSPFVGQRLRTFIAGEDGDRLAALDTMVDAGQLTPLIDRTYPLADAADAIRHIDEGRACGKVVLTI